MELQDEISEGEPSLESIQVSRIIQSDRFKHGKFLRPKKYKNLNKPKDAHKNID